MRGSEFFFCTNQNKFTFEGFLAIIFVYISHHQISVPWQLLRKFGYDNELTLQVRSPFRVLFCESQCLNTTLLVQVPRAISSLPDEILAAAGTSSPLAPELSPSALEFLYVSALSSLSVARGWNSVDKHQIGTCEIIVLIA
jgi:hypothetical protein